GLAATVTGGHGPWATLAHADSAAALGASGTVIHVANGTYSANPINMTKGGTSDSVRFEWRCDNQSNASMNWPCHLTGGGGVSVSGPYINFVGFDYTSNSGADLYALRAGNDFQHIQNNRIHDTVGVCTVTGGAGINAGEASHTKGRGMIVTGNWIFNIDLGSGGWGNRCHGIYAVLNQATIENNVIFN